jgi:hypothetical protein
MSLPVVPPHDLATAHIFVAYVYFRGKKPHPSPQRRIGGNHGDSQSMIAVNGRSVQITNERESAVGAKQGQLKQTSV